MTKLLAAIVTAVLRALVPVVIEQARPSAADARPQPELRRRLRERVRRTWPILAVALALWAVAGCTRTIYVPHGEPVRLRETVEEVDVWIASPDGETVAGEIDLPEGWYALPVPPED